MKVEISSVNATDGTFEQLIADNVRGRAIAATIVYVDGDRYGTVRYEGERAALAAMYEEYWGGTAEELEDLVVEEG